MPKLNKPEIPGYKYAHPEETSAKSLTPHPKERVLESQSSDIERIKKGLDTSETRPQNRSQVQSAAGRAVTRSLGRAGAAGAALEAGRAIGEEIDKRTGAGKAMVEKSGLGGLADKAINSRDKVELSKDAKERVADEKGWNEVKRALRETDEDIEASKYAKPDQYKRGGKVKPTASSRGDGIAQRGKTRGRYL